MEEFIINIKNPFMYVYSKWDEKEILFKIIDHKENNWTGSIHIEEVQNIASELEIDYDVFIIEIKNSLIKPSDIFLYEVQNEKFLLKKNGDLKVIYLEINLILFHGNLKDELLTKSIGIIYKINSKLAQLTDNFNENSKELATIKRDIEKLGEDKSRSEQILLNKVSLLLNSKKDEISKLKELLYEKEQNQGSINHSADTDGEDEDDFAAPTQKIPNTQKVINLPRRKK